MMNEPQIILRKWSGRIRTADEEAYVAYIAKTGLKEYSETPGNLGYQMMLRTIGDGVSEVTTLSWWRDMDAVRGFAGQQPERAVYYPEDDRYLLDRPEFVEHHRVFASDIRLGEARHPD
jgi:heme-degrading monooxygenase HmoA